MATWLLRVAWWWHRRADVRVFVAAPSLLGLFLRSPIHHFWVVLSGLLHPSSAELRWRLKHDFGGRFMESSYCSSSPKTVMRVLQMAATATFRWAVSLQDCLVAWGAFEPGSKGHTEGLRGRVGFPQKEKLLAGELNLAGLAGVDASVCFWSSSPGLLG